MFCKRTEGFLKSILILSFLSISAYAAKPAPDFTLSDINGTKTTLSAQKGKVVFIDFWASWCPPCRASIPKVEKLYEKYKGANVVFYGINVENDSNAAKKFAVKQGIQYTVLIGDENVSKDYEINGIPAFYIIDQQGNIAEHYVGFSYGVDDQWADRIDALLLSSQKPVKKIKQ